MLMMAIGVSTSLHFILFACSLTAAATEACTASDKSSCKSWTTAVEAEDRGQGLELLQVRGSRASSKICPVPDIRNMQTKFTTMSKGCPPHDTEGNSMCLDGNRAYDTFSDAWEKCGLTVDCGFVERYSNGAFYLRRKDDPDDASHKNVKVFEYTCPQLLADQKTIEKSAMHLAKKMATKMRAEEEEEEETELEHEEEKLKAKIDPELAKKEKAIASEEKKVAKIHIKAAKLSREAEEAPARIEEERKEEAILNDKLEIAGRAEAKAEKLAKQDAKVEKAEEQLEQVLEQEAKEVEESNSKYEEFVDEAEEEMGHTMKMEQQIKKIKDKENKEMEELQARDSKALRSKAELEKKMEDLKESEREVAEELDNLSQKEKTEKVRLLKERLYLTKAQKGEYEQEMFDFENIL